MIIDLKKLTAEELTTVTQDLSEILTKKLYTGATFSFWNDLLKGIIREADRRLDEAYDKEP